MENNQEKENFPGKMAQNMRETLKIPYDMDLEFKHSRKDQSLKVTRVNLKMICSVEEEPCFGETDSCTMDRGIMDSGKDLAD